MTPLCFKSILNSFYLEIESHIPKVAPDRSSRSSSAPQAFQAFFLPLLWCLSLMALAVPLTVAWGHCFVPVLTGFLCLPWACPLLHLCSSYFPLNSPDVPPLQGFLDSCPITYIFLCASVVPSPLCLYSEAFCLIDI